MPVQLEYKKGDIIYKEGDFEMSMFHIISGKVEIFANYGKENEMLLTEESKGDYFGHFELIEAIPRSATIIASEDVVVEKIMGEEFGSYISLHPEESMLILTQMSKRLREIGSELHNVYYTIDEYLSQDKQNNNQSFLKRWARIIKIGKVAK